MNSTSIIIPSFNERQLLLDCIYSIREHTRIPYEIIVVDNASTDGTLDDLVREQIPFVSFSENRGFPAACNAGMKLARGSSILLLNNDVLLTPNWLDHMLTCLYHRHDIGIVGPMTNYASGVQQMKEPYTNMSDMILKFNVGNKGKYTEVKRLIGFCFLFKREVMDKIGYLDEQFSPGHYEDDDYCYRARKAGYKLMLTEDTFIFHHGSASFGKKSESQLQAIVERSRKLFIEKWGVDPQAFF